MRVRVVAVIGATAVLVGILAGLIAARLTTWNLFALTAHQLDVLRTIGSVVGGIGGLGGGVSAVGAFLARHWAKKAATNTATTSWVDGHLRDTPVTEYARHAAYTGEATRQEVGNLAGWVRGNGRYRAPTAEIPRLEESSP